jgi:hypothetical protein
MTPRNGSGRAREARPDLYQPICTDGAPGTARGHIGDARYIERVLGFVQAGVAHSHSGVRDARGPIPTHR